MTPTPDPSTARGRAFWLGLALLWFAAAAAGLAGMAAYANRPGPPAHASDRWPAASRLARDTTRPTLVVLLHPKCDCSRATLAELANLMAAAPRRTRAYVVVMKPASVADGWERTSLWTTAAKIPGVAVVRDDDGQEASNFGAETSGQALLYAGDGRLLFSGGLTAARGHEGRNVGESAILALVSDRAADATTTPVFGCSLFGTNQTGLRGEPR